MDKSKIINTLGLIPGGEMTISDIQMVQWGRDIIFECIYRTAAENVEPDAPVLFRLVFQDCREIKYRIYAHIGVHEQGQVTKTADVVELSLGQGNHRRDANILTNHFAVTLSYGDIRIEYDDEFFVLAN